MASSDDEAEMMTEDHKAILTRLQKKLAENIRVDSVLNDLVAEGVITWKEHGDLLEEKSSKQAGAMLRLIVEREDKGFYVLIKALRDSKQKALANLIEKEEASCIANKQAKKRKHKQAEEKPAPKTSKKAKTEPSAGVSGSQSDSDYESDVEGFDVSDGPYPVNVKHCSEEFYLQHRKGAYKMYKETRGKALIINVNEVVGAGPRTGTDVDRDNLEQLFKQLHMDVTVYNDEDGLTAQGIEDKVREFALPENHQDSQCAVLAVLSHGTEGFVYGTDKKKIGVDKLRYFLTSKNCSTLVGSPKLSLFQACRGSLQDDGVDHPLDVDDDLMADHGDEIVGFPTKTGYKAWRNEAEGSWFISAVVDVFQKHAHHMHVLDMLTRVNGLVRRKVTGKTIQYENRDKLQMTEVYNSVGKSWYLFPGIQREEY